MLKTLLLGKWELGNRDAPMGHALIYAKDIVCGYMVAEVGINDPAEHALSVAHRRGVKLDQLKDFELEPSVHADVSHVCNNNMQDVITYHLRMEADIIPVDKYVTWEEMTAIVDQYADLYNAYISKMGIDSLLEEHYFLESAV